jgi:hypothetical protein
VDLSQVKLKKSFSSHVVLIAEKVQDLRKIANVLIKREEVLAVEWLDKKREFGLKASVAEMSGFKSKVKK